MTHSVTLPAGNLAGLLAEAIPFAGTDDTLPVLKAVRLEARGGWITATATDRYVLGQSRCETAADPVADLPQVLVPLAAVKDILATAKLAKAGSVSLTLTDAGTTAARLVVETPNGRSEHRVLDGEFPRVASIATGFAKPTYNAGQPFSLGGALLAKLAKAAGKRPLLFFVYDPRKPVHFTIGDTVRGAVMPVRIGGDTEISGPSVPWDLA